MTVGQEHREGHPSLWVAVESFAPKIGCEPQMLPECCELGQMFDSLRRKLRCLKPATLDEHVFLLQ